MGFPFGSRQHVFDVVEAADETRPEIEPHCDVRWARAPRLVEHRESRPQRVVHDGAKRSLLFSRQAFQPRGHILIQRQCRSHIMMIDN